MANAVERLMRWGGVAVFSAACFIACGGAKSVSDDEAADASMPPGKKDGGPTAVTTKDGGNKDGAVDTTDADVGDDAATVDAAPQCTKGSDCMSTICLMGACQAPTCMDGAKNQDETDIDCGGATCKPCDVMKACAAGTDCISKVCADAGTGGGMQCQAPTCMDMTQNGTETGQDCGGSCGPCATGLGCLVRTDCQTDVCTGNVCVAAVCDDHVQNGTETDVDCGGFNCPSCPDLEKCLIGSDCSSQVCKTDVCQVPTKSDHVQNGTETDVDCGGGPPSNALPCASGLKCVANADCASVGCDYSSHCALRRSCTNHYGGDTCGTGGAGGVGAANWDSCCTSIPVTVGATTTQLDKYKVTAGRMRAFLESIGGNVRGFVQSARAAGTLPKSASDATHTVLEPAWDPYLPTSFVGSPTYVDGNGVTQNELTDCGFNETCTPSPAANPTGVQGFYTSAYRHVGGTIFRNNVQGQQGCSITSPGTHTYWMPATVQADYFGDMPAEVTQTDDDMKPLQCVDYLVGQAFCVWDGGRLETVAEAAVAFGAGTYPWGNAPNPLGVGSGTYYGCRYPTITDALLNGGMSGCSAVPGAGNSIEYADYDYSYEYPHLQNTDFAVFISAPGRYSTRGPLGHADVSYDVFEFTSNVTYNASPFSAQHNWIFTGSWEGHQQSKGANYTTMILDKYGKSGLRCAH